MMARFTAGAPRVIQLLLAVVCTIVAPADSRAQSAKPDGRPTTAVLVRCLPNVDLACLRVAGDFSSMRGDSSQLIGRLDSAVLVGPGLARRDTSSASGLQLLIAYDVSGSMAGDGAAFTRLALTSFLRDMPKTVSVALVPFGSRGVNAGFAQAPFGSPAEAERALRALPPPRNDANTALYSAVDQGLKALTRRSNPGNRSVLLVITDGKNDVRANDDPGLLQGQAAREAVRSAIAASPHRVWLVGAGRGIDANELQALAGDAANAETVDMDPVAIRRLLIRLVDEDLLPSRIMLYGIPLGARTELGRRNRMLSIPAIGTVAWRPPLVALPPFEFLADSALLAPRVRELQSEVTPDLQQRLLIGLPLFLLTLLSYLLLPKIIQSPERPDVSAQPDAPTRVASASRLKAVEEAPPRRATDITLDGAA